MQCERLIKMIKSWYIHVREETMAPARMVGFIEEHASTCDICMQDPDLIGEIAKITELVLPESKIPKAVRQQNIKDKEPEPEVVEESEEEEVETTVEDDDEMEEDLEVGAPDNTSPDSV